MSLMCNFTLCNEINEIYACHKKNTRPQLHIQKREIKQPKLLCCILTSLAAVCINDVIFSQFCATPFFYLQYVVHVEGKEHKNNNAYVK